MGEGEAEMGPLVYQMNHLNTSYKEASKHVRLHITPAKPKAKAKPGACKAKAKARV